MTIEQAINKVLNIAIAELGYREKATNKQLDNKNSNIGSGNWTKYARDLDNIGGVTWGNKNGYAWCAEFTLWVFYKAFGVDLALKVLCSPKPSGIPLCSTGAQYYKNAGRWYTSNPKPGDVIFFYSGGGINHTGIVEKVSGEQITTIEGNSSDMVARRIYNVRNGYIAGYGRPKYELVASGQATNQNTSKVESITASKQTQDVKRNLFVGCKGNDVKDLQEKLITIGYKLPQYGADGDFGSETATAVKQFQKDYHLVVDGVAGKATMAALNKAIKTNSWTPSVGDIVIYSGAVHYSNSMAKNAKKCRGGKAKITSICKDNKAKHPYHLIRIKGSGSTVYGWVDSGTFQKA